MAIKDWKKTGLMAWTKNRDEEARTEWLIYVRHKPKARKYKPYQIWFQDTPIHYPKILASFKTKSLALKFIKNYMRKHQIYVQQQLQSVADNNNIYKGEITIYYMAKRKMKVAKKAAVKNGVAAKRAKWKRYYAAHKAAYKKYRKKSKK